MSWPIPEDEDERMSTLRSLELYKTSVQPKNSPPPPGDAAAPADETRPRPPIPNRAQARHAPAPGI